MRWNILCGDSTALHYFDRLIRILKSYRTGRRFLVNLLGSSIIFRRIRALRADAGLSQRKLALLVGADNTYISRLERGLVNNPTLKFLHRIASALGVELKELFD